jgi:hypothetical protein
MCRICGVTFASAGIAQGRQALGVSLRDCAARWKRHREDRIVPRVRRQLRISVIVDACFSLIVDGVSA